MRCKTGVAPSSASKSVPCNPLEKIDIALGNLDADLVVEFGDIVVGNALVAEPEAQEFLVEASRAPRRERGALRRCR